MGRRPSGHAKSNLQAQRDFQDRDCSIDALLEDAWKKVDWNRRDKAERGGIVEWTNTYMLGLTLEDPPPPLGQKILKEMEHAITAHSNYAIAMARGSGKSAYTITTAVYALALGLQKFIVIVTANARASTGILNDMWRVFQVPDSTFAKDYPELVLPFTIANGSFKRRQLFDKTSTDISKTANQLVLPSYSDPRFQRASGSLVTTRSITGALRGIRRFTMRPSFVIIDDIQTTTSAQNPEQVEKLYETIQKDIIPLAGKERLSILQTFTPICDGDLVAKIREDSTWHTTIYPAIIKYPKNMKLWEEYFQMWSEENLTHTPHDQSLAFYKERFDEMNEGAEVFNPMRFSEKDGHITALQKLLELRATVGESAWASEYQMNPIQLQLAIPITPEIVASRKSSLKMLEVPTENVQWVCASTDLNLSKWLTTTIVVFMRDQTSVVIYHKFRKSNIPANIPEEDYYRRVYNLLSEHGKELKALGVHLDAWTIDANGTPFNAVTDFCRNSMRICGLPAGAFIGKASHMYRSYLKTRLKEDVNRTLLCGNDDEHRKFGTGRRYTFFDSDMYHEKAQQGFLQALGNIGSISWYDGNDHAKWAI